MLVDGTTFGIIPDSFDTILSNYLEQLAPIFPNATNPDSPTYIQFYVKSVFDKKIQDALQILWNSINSNTASGLGLDILSSTILNLTRRPATKSSCDVTIEVGPIYSTCDVIVTVTSGSGTLPTGWLFYSEAILPDTYRYLGNSINVPGPGLYYLTISSTDTTTPIPSGSVTGADPLPGLNFTIINPQSAKLGQLTIPTSWKVSASYLGSSSPTYSPSQNLVFDTPGFKDVTLYSDEILTSIAQGRLDTVSSNFGGQILGIYNPNSSLLGLAQETDEQLAKRRQIYLNVEGSTYYGLEKVILGLQVPGLQSVEVQEIINDSDVSSICIIELVVDLGTSPSVLIPAGWTVSGSVSPTSEYKTNEEFVFQTSGTKYIAVFSRDLVTEIPAGAFTSADSPYPTQITSINNPSPAVLGALNGLGSRGYAVYLSYPLGFDGKLNPEDPYLKLIAQSCYNYHSFGTQFYPGPVGGTTYYIDTPYSGYKSEVILNPVSQSPVTCNLRIIYNTTPQDSGIGNGVFDTALLGNLKDLLLTIINNYFLSKTLPSDTLYSTNELYKIIQSSFTGIVALIGNSTYFSFGYLGSVGLTYLRRVPGSIFNLSPANFQFSAVDKSA
jgi:hypothetical protein